MRFWKEHTTLRAVLMAIFVVLGFVLLIVGWKMTGQLTGLALMLAGRAAADRPDALQQAV